MRALPLARASAIEPVDTRSSNEMTSALMKPFSKSVWMTPAACGAFPLVDRPGARLLRAGREVGLQAERVEADAGELIEPDSSCPVDASSSAASARVEVDQLRLDLRVEEHRLGGATSAASSALLRGSVSTASSTLNT